MKSDVESSFPVECRYDEHLCLRSNCLAGNFTVCKMLCVSQMLPHVIFANEEFVVQLYFWLHT